MGERARAATWGLRPQAGEAAGAGGRALLQGCMAPVTRVVARVQHSVGFVLPDVWRYAVRRSQYDVHQIGWTDQAKACFDAYEQRCLDRIDAKYSDGFFIARNAEMAIRIARSLQIVAGGTAVTPRKDNECRLHSRRRISGRSVASMGAAGSATTAARATGASRVA
jgi:hypothetical protein